MNKYEAYFIFLYNGNQMQADSNLLETENFFIAGRKRNQGRYEIKFSETANLHIRYA